MLTVIITGLCHLEYQNYRKQQTGRQRKGDFLKKGESLVTEWMMLSVTKPWQKKVNYILKLDNESGLSKKVFVSQNMHTESCMAHISVGWVVEKWKMRRWDEERRGQKDHHTDHAALHTDCTWAHEVLYAQCVYCMFNAWWRIRSIIHAKWTAGVLTRK